MKVLIRGAGEHASGTAHRLFRCGFQVAVTEIPRPTLVRRLVSFGSAVVLGEIEVEGVVGRVGEAGTRAHVPVVIDPAFETCALWRPDVVVDARILKRNDGNSLTLAPLVIGLGPGIEAGRDVHVVVETNRGHDLGRLIPHGFAAPDTGTPGTISGIAGARVLRAPLAGIVHAMKEIGDPVQKDDIVCTVSGHPVLASTAGVVRGLVFDGTSVPAGLKIGDVDPRGDPTFCRTLSDKTRTISGAVLEAILSLGDRHELP